ncbi:hypothetical protein KQX54_019329 [Cotesia glomerata]|uniref:Uncharacterized protein n=1 Tax=Cotesia glomerata TaxID=32391 RepID=A0AAV7J082_COTGL|nr:hypothetical protein KQX54_019329 [Cotesia glomerata]
MDQESDFKFWIESCPGKWFIRKERIRPRIQGKIEKMTVVYGVQLFRERNRRRKLSNVCLTKVNASVKVLDNPLSAHNFPERKEEPAENYGAENALRFFTSNRETFGGRYSE